MRRLVLVAATAVATAAAVATPSYAESPGSGTGTVQHLTFAYPEDPVLTRVDGLGAGCPAFTGTLEEDRYLEVSGIMKPDGTGHARTDVAATVTLTPDDAAAVSYAGSYAQHQTGFFVDEGHGDRTATTTTHGTIIGSDGSTWRITEVAHFSVDATGTVRATFDRMRCEH
jgi:hypothetical protein